MSYANILVSVDLDETALDRVRLAAGLARRFGATLTGAAAQKVPAPLLVRDIEDAVRQEEENQLKVRAVLDRARAQFFASVDAESRTDWREALVGSATYLVDQARAADLVVVGRRGPEDDAAGALGAIPGSILMEAGRPVLVVPPRVAHLAAARIVIAWKDGVEARRAVSAALPLLRAADQVFVVGVGDNARHERAEDVAGHLARHGASVTMRLLEPVGSAGDEILRFTREQEADLVVMGAYGRSRLSEWMFGGVTRAFLQHSPVCCLMCH